MPSFNGLPIFGLSPIIATSNNPAARQENTFFGVNGKESLAGGTRGYVTTVSGVLRGDDAPSLFEALQAFRQLANGRSYVLIDSFGVSWPEVVCVSFEPTGRVRQDPDGIGFFQTYQARFEHLQAPDDGN